MSIHTMYLDGLLFSKQFSPKSWAKWYPCIDDSQITTRDHKLTLNGKCLPNNTELVLLAFV